MSKKLFLVCPFSCLEPIIQKEYGNEVYFTTSMGAVFQANSAQYLLALKEFIQRKDISSIYIVNETSCRFLNKVIKKEKLYGMPFEQCIESLLTANYNDSFKGKTLKEQQQKLAELNIQKQAEKMADFAIFGTEVLEKNLEIKGLICIKSERKFSEITLNLEIQKSAYQQSN